MSIHPFTGEQHYAALSPSDKVELLQACNILTMIADPHYYTDHGSLPPDQIINIFLTGWQLEQHIANRTSVLDNHVDPYEDDPEYVDDPYSPQDVADQPPSPAQLAPDHPDYDPR